MRTNIIFHKIYLNLTPPRLQKFEIPRGVCLVSEVWTPESGLLTAALKLKRRTIEDKFRAEIARLQGEVAGPPLSPFHNLHKAEEAPAVSAGNSGPNLTVPTS